MATPKGFHLTYKRCIQKCSSSMLGSDNEAKFYSRLIWNDPIPGITIFRGYDPASDVYYFAMFKRRVYVATGYMYRQDLEEFVERGYDILSSNKPTGISFNTESTTGTITYSTATAPIAPTTISTTTNTINTTNTAKDKTMGIDYDAATIDTMIEELLQKKAELADIESRWKKDEDFNDGDVIVVEYAYSADEDAKVYTGALLKTKVGWFATLTDTLHGANKYSQVVKFFENRCIKKVTYLALSEGVVMFSNVEDDVDPNLPDARYGTCSL